MNVKVNQRLVWLLFEAPSNTAIFFVYGYVFTVGIGVLNGGVYYLTV
jgi:hypothetical protein